VNAHQGTPVPAPGKPALPIDPHLPDLCAALSRRGAAVVKAPPGSGKTTRIPPALEAAGLLAGGACVVLEPRRVAARAAARWVAGENGWELGRQVGYQVRHDRCGTAATRIWYVTEGVLVSRLQADPELAGVAAVVLDEFHERSLEADLALAFLREVREALRPDLKVIVCSATLDPGPVARFLDAPVLEVPGRPHPVEVRYLDRPDPDPLPLRVARGVRRAWPHRPGGRGDVLAFLPGAAEIRRTARALQGWAGEAGADLVPLHGDLPAERQDAALAPAARPRVILATNVAETSLTLPGVRTVVDSGYARELRHDPATGLDRLETVPVSRANADQRAGRAGRLGPGFALRLWTRHDDRSRPAEPQPAIRREDLGRAVLEVLAWGAPDPAAFGWFEAPDPARLEAAVELLRLLGAVGPDGRITPLGEALRRLPLTPRLAALAREAARQGCPWQGALAAALLEERDVVASGRAFGRGHEAPTGPSDVLWRIELLEEARRAGFRPERLRALGLEPGACRAVWRAARQIRRLVGDPGPAEKQAGPSGLLRALWAAFPDRVARRREPGSDRFVLAGGRGGRLDPRSGVRRAEWIVAVRLDAGGRGERSEATIRWASEVDPAWLRHHPGTRTRTETRYDPASQRVVAAEVTAHQGLVLRERPVAPDPAQALELLVPVVREDPERLLGLSGEASRLVARCRFLARALPGAGFPAWAAGDWERLLRRAAWGALSLADLRRTDWAAAIRGFLGWEAVQRLDRDAPDRIQVPSGSRIRVEYPDGADPFLPVKIQEVFGWAEAPRVAGGRVAVVLHLLGPHGRPLHVTRDLASFWENVYPEVRKEMRGRYPKHRWPEDPWTAAPSRSTVKPRARRG